MSSCIHIGSADTHGANTIRIRTFAMGKKSFTLLYTRQDDEDDPCNTELNMFDLLAKLSSTFCLFEEGTYKMWVAQFDTSRVIVKHQTGGFYETHKRNTSYHWTADGDLVIFANQGNGNGERDEEGNMTIDELVHFATYPEFDVYETQKHNISYHWMADGDVVIFVNEGNEEGKMTTDELVDLATNNDPDLAAQKIRDGSNEHDMSASVVKYI